MIVEFGAVPPRLVARIFANTLRGVETAIDRENRPGAGGVIAWTRSQSNAHGYTLAFLRINVPLLLALYKKLPFDLCRDFVPISNIATLPKHLGG